MSTRPTKAEGRLWRTGFCLRLATDAILHWGWILGDVVELLVAKMERQGLGIAGIRPDVGGGDAAGGEQGGRLRSNWGAGQLAVGLGRRMGVLQALRRLLIQAFNVCSVGARG